MRSSVKSICAIPEDLLYEALCASILNEGGDRIFPYNVFKWWSRRFSVLARFLATSLITIDKDILRSIIKGSIPNEVSTRAKGKLVYDPFCGAGTILVEVARLGFDALGIDVNPVAVAIAKSSYELARECKLKHISPSWRLLLKSLRKTFQELWRLWVINDEYLVIHTFLSRCPPCCAPVWLTTRRRKDYSQYLLINAQGNLIWINEEEIDTKITPKSPCIDLSHFRDYLPHVGNYYAYAVELMHLQSKERLFVSLLKKDSLSKSIREHFTKAMEDSRRVLKEQYPEFLHIKIPTFRETKRLLRYGIIKIHELFTPRQLLSLLSFINNTDESARKLAALIAGNVARTTSLLAMYYQPYSKVNPGLQIKSYWLPSNPVELNPLAHVISEDGESIRTIGRGTVATYISKMARSCRKRVSEIRGSITVKCADCRSFEPPRNVFAVITDPPYPGLFTYRELSLLYEYFLRGYEQLWGISYCSKNESREIDVFKEESYVKSMEALAERLKNLNRGIPIILLIGIKSPKYVRVLRKVVQAFKERNIHLAKIYWFIGETFGKMGRTKSRGIFVLVFANKVNVNTDLSRDLVLARRLLGRIYENKKIRKLINIEHELEVIRGVEQELRRIL